MEYKTEPTKKVASSSWTLSKEEGDEDSMERDLEDALCTVDEAAAEQGGDESAAGGDNGIFFFKS